MATKKKKVSTIKLSDKAKAKDAALAETLKEDRAAERKLKKEQEIPGNTSRKYSKDVSAAIEAHDADVAAPMIHRKFTPIVEKELDIVESEKSLAAYKADPKKGGLYNAYFIDLYTGFLVTLRKELKQLKKEN